MKKEAQLTLFRAKLGSRDMTRHTRPLRIEIASHGFWDSCEGIEPHVFGKKDFGQAKIWIQSGDGNEQMELYHQIDAALGKDRPEHQEEKGAPVLEVFPKEKILDSRQFPGRVEVVFYPGDAWGSAGYAWGSPGYVGMRFCYKGRPFLQAARDTLSLITEGVEFEVAKVSCEVTRVTYQFQKDRDCFVSLGELEAQKLRDLFGLV